VLVLAAVDFVGAVLAKEWVEERNHWLFAGGLAAFGALFAVYAVSLRLAELSAAPPCARQTARSRSRWPRLRVCLAAAAQRSPGHSRRRTA
jgi:hypothetical protein